MAGSDPPDGEKQARPPAKTQKERAEERRREKLEHIQDQVDKGELTIRQMTPEERSESDSHPRPSRTKPDRRR